MSQPRTVIQKIWDNHVVQSEAGKPDLLYIDLHLVHEVTSPQAFEGLRIAGRKVRRPDLTLATVDHNVPDILLARGLTIMTNTIKTTKNPYATMAYQNTRYTWPHMWHR